MKGPLLAGLNSGLPDATAIAEAVRNGKLTAAEVLSGAQARATSSDGRAINAFITEDWDNAARSAEGIDRRRAAGEVLGHFAGVPFSVKDVIAAAGLPVTAASTAFADAVASVTAPAVQRLLDEDAVLVGKTNCPEFAFGMTCESPLLGRTANPRFPKATPGGSSGGEAASLAAGISALGIGTDFGGSVRWPAQCVGVAALRPGLEAIPGEGQVPGPGGNFGTEGIMPAVSPGMQGSFQTIGPMARSVRDLRTAFLVMSGTADNAGSEIGAQQLGTRKLRIVWTDGSALGPVRREVTSLMERIAVLLASEGHEVHEMPGLFAECLAAYNALRAADPMLDHSAAILGREHTITPANLRTIESSLSVPPVDVERSWEAARAAREAAVTQIAAVDIVLLPVAGGPASDVDGVLDIDGYNAQGWEIMGHCRAVTLTGCPSVSLPMALSTEGLPLSIQVVAAPGQELAALDFAARLEQLAP